MKIKRYNIAGLAGLVGLVGLGLGRSLMGTSALVQTGVPQDSKGATYTATLPATLKAGSTPLTTTWSFATNP